ncbi:MAG: PP0621 family protein [Hylemonella sp.]|nr:PP0621 family protein [Hylemonella sp.]
MKFLLFLAIVLLVAWMWRSSRRRDKRPDQAAAPPQASPQEMVRCAHCGVHLPRGDAVVGRIAQYCSREHQQNAEP